MHSYRLAQMFCLSCSLVTIVVADELRENQHTAIFQQPKVALAIAKWCEQRNIPCMVTTFIFGRLPKPEEIVANTNKDIISALNLRSIPLKGLKIIVPNWTVAPSREEQQRVINSILRRKLSGLVMEQFIMCLTQRQLRILSMHSLPIEELNPEQIRLLESEFSTLVGGAEAWKHFLHGQRIALRFGARAYVFDEKGRQVLELKPKPRIVGRVHPFLERRGHFASVKRRAIELKEVGLKGKCMITHTQLMTLSNLARYVNLNLKITHPVAKRRFAITRGQYQLCEMIAGVEASCGVELRRVGKLWVLGPDHDWNQLLADRQWAVWNESLWSKIKILCKRLHTKLQLAGYPMRKLMQPRLYKVANASSNELRAIARALFSKPSEASAIPRKWLYYPALMPSVMLVGRKRKIGSSFSCVPDVFWLLVRIHWVNQR